MLPLREKNRNYMRMMRRFGVSLLLCSLLCACGDEDLLKFDKIDGVENWTPELNLQVAHAEYSVWGLIDQYDEEADIVLQDGQIVIRHEENDIYSLDVMSELELPEILAQFSCPFDVSSLNGITLTEAFSLELPGQIEVAFDEGELRELLLSLKMNYTRPSVDFAYEAAITLENVYRDAGKTTPVIIPLAGSMENLTDVVFDFPADKSTNTLYYKLKLEIPDEEEVTANTLNFGFRFTDLSFTKITGKINEKTIAIPGDSFDMNVDFWDDFEGSFYFTNPRVGLKVEKQRLSFPFDVQMDFVAYGDGKSETFSGTALEFRGADEEIIRWYDVSNSNIAALLSLPPKERLDYAGSVVINPGGTDEITVWNDGTASVGAIVEIPLELKADELTFNDTIDVDKIDQDIVDKIQEAKIRISAENYIPLELGDGRLILLDENHNRIDEITVENFIDAPVVNAVGEVTAPAVSSYLIPLSEENIANLVRMKYLLLSVSAQTSDGGNTPVKILPDAKLKIALGIEAKLDISDL